MTDGTKINVLQFKPYTQLRLRFWKRPVDFVLVFHMEGVGAGWAHFVSGCVLWAVGVGGERQVSSLG